MCLTRSDPAADQQDAVGRLREKEASRPTVEATIEGFKKRLEDPWCVVMIRALLSVRGALLDEVLLVTCRYLVNPEGKFMQKWDAVTTAALLFTAVITPYEV